MITDAINKRYSSLSETTCCLSCGGAINYANPLVGEVWVDLGSGRGNDVVRLAETVGNNGYVYGIDISEGMIAKAQSLIEKFDITNAKIIQSNLENIPLQDNSVDVVLNFLLFNAYWCSESTFSKSRRGRCIVD